MPTLSPLFRRLRTKRAGSLLLEGILAVGVFALFLGGIGLVLILGERSTTAGGDHVRGAFLAEQQLEVARYIRDAKFGYLTNGLHGVRSTNTGWLLSGTGNTTTDGYRTSLRLTASGSDKVMVTAVAAWNFGQSRSGSVVISSLLTNWRKGLTIGNWTGMTRQSDTSQSGTPTFDHIAVSGNYAYVTGSNASAHGLYIYDISNLASPVRVSSSFSLGVAAYGLAIDGTRLYIATNSVGSEVQLYDISSPTTLSTSNLLGSYDLPGSGRARSIAVYGSTVYVGTTESATESEFYTFEADSTGTFNLLDSLDMSGHVNDIRLHEGYAYCATSNNAGEMMVVDIFDPEDIVFAPDTGVDATDVQDGMVMSLFGTSALLGRVNGTTIDELLLYSKANDPVPSPPPGPWTLEINGTVNALDATPGGQYAFVGATTDATGLRVVDVQKLSTNQASVVKTYDTTTSVIGLVYDASRDRLFVVTTDHLMIFKPS